MFISGSCMCRAHSRHLVSGNSQALDLLIMSVLSRIWLFATLWTVAHQAPPSMGFSRQEYWSGLPFPSPGDLPNPGIKPRSPALQADALTSQPPGKPFWVRGKLLAFYWYNLTKCKRKCSLFWLLVCSGNILNISFQNLVSDPCEICAVVSQVTRVFLVICNLQAVISAEQEHSWTPAVPSILWTVWLREALSSSEGGIMWFQNSES